MENSNFSKNVLENAIAKAYKAQKTELNTQGQDLILRDGRTAEIKNITASKPTLGMITADKLGIKSLKELIKSMLKADVYLFYIGSQEVVEIENIKEYNKSEVIEYLMDRVVLDRESSKRGGRSKLRIGKNPRTENATQKLINYGLAIS